MCCFTAAQRPYLCIWQQYLKFLGEQHASLFPAHLVRVRLTPRPSHPVLGTGGCGRDRALAASLSVSSGLGFTFQGRERTFSPCGSAPLGTSYSEPLAGVSLRVEPENEASPEEVTAETQRLLESPESAFCRCPAGHGALLFMRPVRIASSFYCKQAPEAGTAPALWKGDRAVVPVSPQRCSVFRHVH